MRLAWAAVLLALGSFGLAAGWSGAAFPVLAVIAIAPLMIFAGAIRLRAPTAVTALAVLAVGAGLAYVLVLAPEGTSVSAAIRDALPRLLTTRRPAPPAPQLVLPGAVLCLLVGVWVALRTVPDPTRATRRGRGLVAAPLGALLLYAAGALLTAGGADRGGVLAGAIVAVSAGGWILLDRPAGSAARGRGRALIGLRGAGVAALIGALAIAPAYLVSPFDAFEPRHLVDPPQRTLERSSPLPLLGAWHERGTVELFRVTPTNGSPPPPRLRLVTLTAYTGVAWSANATYRPVGVVGPTQLPPGPQRSTVDAEITIGALAGVWLPGLGHPLDVSMSNVDCEAEGGSLALTDGELRPGLRYRLRAEQDSAGAEQVATAAAPSADEAGLLLDLPRAPAVFAEYARRSTFGASTPFEQAVALEYAVREGRRYDPQAAVGSSYARLSTFLFAPAGGQPGAQVGSSEQFAAAFAVLARSVGLPSRVVLGFRAGPDGVVRGRDALAWPEVYFAGHGWYPFDPTPGTADPAAEDVKLLALDRMDQQATQAVVIPSPTPAAIAPPTRPTPRPSPTMAAPPAPPTGPSLTPLYAFLLVLVSTVGALAALRAGRSARHRRAGARGAWSEVLDLLVLLGRPAPRSRTATDIAFDLAALAPVTGDGAHPAVQIAEAAERATFSPSAGVADLPGAPAWAQVRSVRRAVRSAVPLRRRLLWTFDPRPLRRRPRG